MPVEIQMIELNPFTKFTSACLFNWNRDMAIFKVSPQLIFHLFFYTYILKKQTLIFEKNVIGAKEV
jgi:hypothetical protein